MSQVNCGKCGEIHDKMAVFCSSCGNPLRTPPSALPARIELLQIGPVIVGIIGAAIIALGVFLPFVKLPVVGELNYFNNAQGDGLLLLILASVTALACACKIHWAPIVTGLVSGIILLIDTVNTLVKIQGVKDQMARELADNPYRGLAEGMLQGAQLSVGPIVIAMGIILLFVSAGWGLALDAQTRQAK